MRFLALAPFLLLPAFAAEHWVGAWSVATYTPGALARFTGQAAQGIENQTIRNVVHLSAGGRALRLRLTNTSGKQPVTFDAVSLAVQEKDRQAKAGTLHPVTFGGGPQVTLSDGAFALSDPIDIKTAPDENLLVSLYSKAATGPVTLGGSRQTHYLSTPGDFTRSLEGLEFSTKITAAFFLDEVDVLTTVPGAIVTLGDSITAGSAATVDANTRWPDVLARRLNHRLAVMNAGIGGNRVLTTSPCFGQNALARLDRDVFGRAGVLAVILFEGTNDLGHPENLESQNPAIRTCLEDAHRFPPQQMIEAYHQIIVRAHQHGLKIHGATILPYGGYGAWTAEAEAKRVAINQWIRTSHEFDGVIDFDTALADPKNPSHLAAAFDSGDHLHPNDAGHKAMAGAINLKLFVK